MVDVATLAIKVTSDQVVKADSDLARLGKTSQTVEKSTGLVDKSVRRMSGGMQEASKGTSGLLTGLGGLKGIIATLGLAQLGTTMLSTARDFEAGMNDVQEKLNATADEMATLEAYALQLGKTTSKSATEAAQGLATLGASGFDAVEAMELLPNIMNLAAASQLSMAEASRLGGTAMNVFGVEIGKAAGTMNILAGVADISQSTTEQFGQALKNAGPVAAKFGISLEETAAAAALLADKGTLGAEAGTALASGMTKLIKPVGEGEKALASMNLAASDFIRIGPNGEELFIGWAAAADKMSDAGITNTKALAIFGAEGKAILPILENGGDGVREYGAKLLEAASAADQAKTQLQGLPGAFALLGSALEGLSLAVTSRGITDLADTMIRGLATAINVVSDSIASLDPYIDSMIDAFKTAADIVVELGRIVADTAAYRSMAEAIGAVGTAIGPALGYLDDFAIAIIAVTATAPAIGLVVTALKLLGGAALLINPVTLAIAAVGVAAVALMRDWDGVVAWWSGLWDDMIGAAEGFFDYWNGTDLDEKETEINTEGLEFANLATIDFVDLWNGSDLQEMVPEIVSDGIEYVAELANDFFDYWNNTSLQDIVADITSESLEYLFERMFVFVDFWRRLAFEPKEITFNVPDLLNDYGQYAVDVLSFFGNLGTDIVLGLIQGIRDAASNIGADMIKLMGEDPWKALKAWWKSNSPSKRSMELGADIMEGMAIGIEAEAGLLTGAFEGASEAFERFIQDMGQGITEQVILLTNGADAAEAYGYAIGGMTEEEARHAVALRKAQDALRDYNDGIEMGERAMEDLANSQKLFHTELTQGPKAARAMELGMRGMNEAYTDTVAATEAALDMQVRFRDGLIDSISNADNFKDAFRNMGDFLKDWLKEKIAHFAANKIMVAIGMEGGALSGISGQIAGMFGMGGNGPAPGAGSMDAAAGSTTAMQTGGVLSGIAGFGAKLIPVMGGLYAGFSALDKLFGSQQPDRWKVAVQGGQLSTQSGQNVLGQQNQFQLPAGLLSEVQESFDEIGETIGAQAEILGATISGTVLDGFDLAERNIYQENPGERISELLSEATVSGYQEAFSMLGPQVQQIIAGQVDMINGSAEQIGEAFDELVSRVSLVGPAIEAAFLDIDFGGSVDAQVAAIDGLTESLGGLEPAMAGLATYIDVVIPAAEQAEASLAGAATNIDEFNAQLGLSGDAAINTREELRAYVEAQDLSTTAGQDAAAAAILLAGDIGAVEDAMLSAQTNFDTVSAAATRLNLTFDQTSPLATAFADNLVSMMGGLDGFTSATASYYDTFYTAKEKEQAALAASAEAVQEFNAGLGLTGAAVIDTKDEFRAYVESLDLSTAAGQRAFVAAMDVADSMGLVADSGMSLEESISSLPASMQEAFGLLETTTIQAAAEVGLTAGVLGDLGLSAGETSTVLTLLENGVIGAGMSAAALEAALVNVGLTSDQAASIIGVMDENTAGMVEQLGLTSQQLTDVGLSASEAAAVLGLVESGAINVSGSVQVMTDTLMALGLTSDEAKAVIDTLGTSLADSVGSVDPMIAALQNMGLTTEQTASFMSTVMFDASGKVMGSFAMTSEQLINMGFSAEQASQLVGLFSTEAIRVGEVAGVTVDNLSAMGLSVEQSSALFTFLGDEIAAVGSLSGVTVGELMNMGLSLTQANTLVDQFGSTAANAALSIGTTEEGLSSLGLSAGSVESVLRLLDAGMLSVNGNVDNMRALLEGLGLTTTQTNEIINSLTGTTADLGGAITVTAGQLTTLGLSMSQANAAIDLLEQGVIDVGNSAAENRQSLIDLGLTAGQTDAAMSALGLSTGTTGTAAETSAETMKVAGDTFLAGATLIASAAGLSDDAITALTSSLGDTATAANDSSNAVIDWSNQVNSGASLVTGGMVGMAGTLTTAGQSANDASTRVGGAFTNLGTSATNAAGQLDGSAGTVTGALGNLDGSMNVAAGATDGAAGAADTLASSSVSAMGGMVTLQQVMVTVVGATSTLNLILAGAGNTIGAYAGIVQGSTSTINISLGGMAGTITATAGLVRAASTTASGALGNFAGAITAVGRAAASAAGQAAGAARQAASAAGAAASSARGASQSFSSASNFAKDAKSALDSASGFARNASTAASNASNAARAASSFSVSRVDGSFAGGTDYIPYDGFIAELHKGERVLTAKENKQFSAPAGRSVPLPQNQPSNAEVVAQLKVITEELQRTRQQQSDVAARSDQRGGEMVSQQEIMVRSLQESERATELLVRKSGRR